MKIALAFLGEKGHARGGKSKKRGGACSPVRTSASRGLLKEKKNVDVPLREEESRKIKKTGGKADARPRGKESPPIRDKERGNCSSFCLQGMRRREGREVYSPSPRR